MKLSSTGRGAQYTWFRGFRESIQAVMFARNWPARLLDHVPGATRVTSVRHTLNFARAPRPPLRIAFASDLHIGPLTPPSLLERAFGLMDAFAPDVLVLGGDYVFLEATPAVADTLQALVARVTARTKVAVLGNHDLWTDNTILERALTAAGVQLLVNAAVRLPDPHGDVALVGLDDPWTGKPDADRAFAACGDAAVRIAVVHAPEGVPHVAGRGAQLLLCGHTHGGQIALPAGPILVHGPMGRRWPSGLHDVEGMQLFVSRGLGAVDIPMRAYAPADVALFTIE